MDAQLKSRIETMISSEPIFLFMKGNPTFPQCGFSNQVVSILKAYNIPFGHCDVLSDQDVRQGIKEFSDWPTIPQLYIKSEFVGGCDIVRESWESGELTEQLQAALPDQKIEAPKPPSRPENISAAQAAQMLKNNPEYHFLDVRQPDEREIVSVDGFEMLDQALAQKLVDDKDRETPLVFMCHFGGRSSQAAQWFAGQGFQKTYNVEGGVDSWAQTVDTSLARY